MKTFSRQFPIKRINSRAHTTIIEGPNLFGPKSSFHSLKKTPPLSLQNIFIIYHMVIRRLEKFLRACEIQLETFDF